MEIGNKIKQLRFKSGLTQEQLAARLGISAQSVSKWENAVTMPDITLLPMLAGELGVTIDELFDLTTDQKLHRIENALEASGELPADVFKEYGDVKAYSLTAPDEVISRIKDAEIVLCNKVLITKEIIDSCPNLRYIGLFAT